LTNAQTKIQFLQITLLNTTAFTVKLRI